MDYILTVYDDIQLLILCVTIPCIGGHTAVHSLMFTLHVGDRQYPVTGPHFITASLPLYITRWVTICFTDHHYIGPIIKGNRAAGVDIQTRGTI